MTEHVDNKPRQIMIIPQSGRGVALIETVSAEMYNSLADIDLEGNNLPIYFDTRGVRHDNVIVMSLGPVQKRR